MLGTPDRTLRQGGGLSALETAIVLIAFVVVASVFAFTMLSAGVLTTGRSKEAVAAGLEEVRGTLKLQGSVVAAAIADGGEVDTIIFSISNVAGGDVIDLSTGANQKVTIGYRDNAQSKPNLTWTVDWPVATDGDNLLEEGELAQVTITGLSTGGANALSPMLGAATPFALEVRPPTGGVLTIERRTPDAVATIMDLK